MAMADYTTLLGLGIHNIQPALLQPDEPHLALLPASALEDASGQEHVGQQDAEQVRLVALKHAPAHAAF
jgi:hypothetical protein